MFCTIDGHHKKQKKRRADWQPLAILSCCKPAFRCPSWSGKCSAEDQHQNFSINQKRITTFDEVGPTSQSHIYTYKYVCVCVCVCTCVYLRLYLLYINIKMQFNVLYIYVYCYITVYIISLFWGSYQSLILVLELSSFKGLWTQLGQFCLWASVSDKNYSLFHRESLIELWEVQKKCGRLSLSRLHSNAMTSYPFVVFLTTFSINSMQ